MKNQQKGSIVSILITIIAVLLIVGGIYIYFNNKNSAPINNNSIQDNKTDSSDKIDTTSINTTAKEKANCGLTITSLSPNTKVSSPIVVTGSIENSDECNWSVFEGYAGIAQLYFNNQNEGWKPLGVSKPVKAYNQTVNNAQFSVTLDFNNGGIGLPSGTPLKIVISDENASGIPSKTKTFEIPLILK